MPVTLKDGRKVHLGMQPPVSSIDTPRYKILTYADGTQKAVAKFSAHYAKKMDAALPPKQKGYSPKAMTAIHQMYGNDVYGDCVIASKYHGIGIWTGNESGAPVIATQAEILNAYYTICGGGRKVDNGCVITEVLDYFKSPGLVAAGQVHVIDDYVAIDWTNKNEVMVAIDVFGSGCIGINLPQAWTCTNCTWSTTNSTIVGGHDVCFVGYSSKGVRICTWGGLVYVEWDAFLDGSGKHITEAYAYLSPDWYAKNNLAPNGINSATLKADLAALQPPAFRTPVSVTLPPWLIPGLQLLCKEVGLLPAGTFKTLVTALCGLVAKKGGFKAGAELTVPPWLLKLAQLACTEVPDLPAPYNTIGAALCALLPLVPSRKCGGCK
jgi:hypothetical protein